MRKHRIVLAALVVVTVAVTVLFVLTPVPRPAESRPTEATNLVLRGYDDGVVTWEASADRGALASETSELAAVTLRIFDGETTTVRATAQSLVEEAGTITLRGGVRGEADDDLGLSTDAMTWSESRKTLEAGPTLLTFGKDELSAAVFRYDTQRRTAELTGIQGTLRRETTLVFSSERGEVSEDTIALDGDVRVASSDADMALSSDSLVVTANGWTARGAVSADIDLTTREEDHGT